MIKSRKLVWLVSALICFVVGCAGFYWGLHKTLELSICVGIFAGLCIASVFVTFRTVRIPAKTFIWAADGRVVRRFPTSVCMWRGKYSNILRDGYPSQAAWEMSYATKASHIELVLTQKIRGHLIFGRTESPEACITFFKLETMNPAWKSFESFTRYIAYEFEKDFQDTFIEDDDFLDECELHNPLEVRQQRIFQNRVVMFLEDFLQKQNVDGLKHCLHIGRGTHFEIHGQAGQWINVPAAKKE